MYTHTHTHSYTHTSTCTHMGNLRQGSVPCGKSIPNLRVQAKRDAIVVEDDDHHWKLVSDTVHTLKISL